MGESSLVFELKRRVCRMQNKCRTVLTVFAVFFTFTLFLVMIFVLVRVVHSPYKPRNVINVTVQEEFTAPESHPQQEGNDGFEPFYWDDSEEYAHEELIKPIKINPPPLHQQDILYDHLRNNQGHPQVPHHSGHFRHKSAEIWDPHPQYEIDAFGKKLLLELSYDDTFVSPNLHIIRMWENYTQRVRHNPNTSGCFYTGTVRGDPNSKVSVSLCHGMTGYIKTTGGTYYIKPLEPFQSLSTESIMHKIGLIPDEETNRIDFDNGCDTNEGLHRVRRSNHPNQLDVPEEEDYFFNGRKKSEQVLLSPKPYFIETLIMADKKMTRYHRTDQNLIHYILTLMSHVALLYKDATIGHPITLTVVDIVILRDVEFTSSTSSDMLRKFCQFQQNYTRKMHDMALLLTRDRISENSTTLGMASVGSMCIPSSSCAIVRDKGLSTSYFIAHELGHLLNMFHDDDIRCSLFQGPEVQNNIMSKSLHNGTKPWHWSACSKHFLTEFLDSPSKSYCLLDEPSKDYITTEFESQHLLPGETYEVDLQCELEFGIGSKICTFMAPCGSLWCTTENGGCRTQHMPWADGTHCGTNSWCHHGKCIKQDRTSLSPIAGGWGDWQEWGSCTRTCGGGIRTSKRECNNPRPANGGPYCTGGAVRYSSCNTQDCDSNVPDFREQQCAVFNGHTRGIMGLTSSVEWLPKYGAKNPDDYCKLYCRVKHHSASYLLRDKVTDGTKCNLNSFDICVNGICHKAGCDNKLDSNKQLDDCGVCNGDNSQCVIFSDYYNRSTYGYNEIIKIPEGSFNIRITQRGYNNSFKDDNYLALRDHETNEYILNGEFQVSPLMKNVFYGGLNIMYSGSNQVIEEINTPKNEKLMKPIIVEVLSVGKVLPPDIEYKYRIGSEHAPKFAWVFTSKYTPCDSICNGYQYSELKCKNLVKEEYTDASECRKLLGYKRENAIPCNTHCKLKWGVVNKGFCSVHCGVGFRLVTYGCFKQNLNNGKEEEVQKEHCHALLPPRREEECTGSCEATHWEYSTWTTCTKSCGVGIQVRQASCVDHDGRTVSDFNCNPEEKFTQQRCNERSCPNWSYDDWKPCSVTCGMGHRTRQYYCLVDQVINDNSFCNRTELQAVEEKCIMASCGPPEWVTGNWSECLDPCATQHREVHCMQNRKRTDDSYCRDLLRPNGTRKCSTTCISNYEDNYIDANNFSWKTGAWTNCSGNCVNRIRRRKVACVNHKNVIKEAYCNPRTRPVDKQACSCYEWAHSSWSKCEDCMQRREVYCQTPQRKRVPDFNCNNLPRPDKKRGCGKACPKSNFSQSAEPRKLGFQWKIGRWGVCSKSCGKGERIRVVSCVDAENTTYVDAYCKLLKKPRTRRTCKQKKCDYIWNEGEWSPCSASCGLGNRYREVSCHRVLHGGIIDNRKLIYNPSLPPNQYCNVYNKPTTVTSCIETNCNDVYRWKKGEWGVCTHPCGKGGRQVRRITCVDQFGNEVQRYRCPKNLKPQRKRKCNEQKCLYESCKDVKHRLNTKENKDYPLVVNGRSASVYCYKMDSSYPEEYISLNPRDGNSAEIFNKRLRRADSCDLREDRDADEETVDNGGGKTIFWKVRLNITSLQIIAEDFTFSKQIYGIQVPYGKAGDCYSNVERCIRGRFSIDLTDTSFRLSRNVQWNLYGTTASKEIQNTDDMQRVIGKCGGYCGSCTPNPQIGLKVEVT